MLSLTNVTKRFGDFTAVSDLSINVESGELYGFLGPNGAGKTTTVKMIIGLMKPNSGTIEVNSNTLAEDAEAIKRITGYIPDRPYVYPQLTLREYLELVEDLYELDPDTARQIRDEYFEKFNLGNWHQNLIKSLSHGMKQKMLFTGVFMMEPELIVIDEPMVGLDPESSRVFKDALRYEVEERNTIVFVSTHSLEVAEDICDRIGILNQGNLIAEGSYNELRSDQNETLEETFLRITSEKTKTAELD